MGYHSIADTQCYYRVWIRDNLPSQVSTFGDCSSDWSAILVTCFQLKTRCHELRVSFDVEVNLFSQYIDIVVVCRSAILIFINTSFPSGWVQGIRCKMSFFVCLVWQCHIVVRNLRKIHQRSSFFIMMKSKKHSHRKSDQMNDLQ